MTVRFVVPATWPAIAKADLSHVTCEAADVGQALRWFTTRYPMFGKRIFAADGTLAPFTLVCVDQVQVHDLHQPIPETGCELQILPALVGG